MTRKTPLCLLACSLLTAPAAWANDTSFGEENGTIVLTQQPDISMVQERLFISRDRVDVNYVFRNTSNRDIDVPVAFPMPPMSFDSSDHSTIKGFKIWVDGQPLKTQRRLVMRLPSGQDISPEVARLGWQEQDVLALLRDEGTMPKGRKPLPRRWFDKDGEPLFTVSEYFTWHQHFSPGQSLQVRHSYAPSVETGVPQPVDYIIDTYGAKTCLDKAGRAGVARRGRDGSVSYGFLRYVLTTGNNWQNGIQDFTLTVRKSAPAEVMSLCLDGELRKKDAVTFEFHAENYHPQRDLSVLFVNDSGIEP